MFRNHRLITLLLLGCLGLFAAAVAPLALTAQEGEEKEIRITLPSGRELTYPVNQIGLTSCMALNHLSEAMKALDPEAEVKRDASSGVYEAKVLGREFSLFRNQNIVLFNKAWLETRGPLVAARGQIFVPLDSVEQILRRFRDVESNVSDLLSTVQLPGLEDQAVPSVGEGAAGEGETEANVDIADIARSLNLQVGQDEDKPQPDFEQDLRRAIQPLIRRRTIVIDPLPPDPPLPSPASEVGPNVTLNVAQRCRDILRSNASLDVVITRGQGSSSLSVRDRLRKINTSDGKLLICLRIDQSPFPKNGGYRVYTVHEAIDPVGRKYHGRQDMPGALPEEAAYIPYENVSLVLGRLIEREMARAGLAGAPQTLRLAPFYLLKRASMPSVSVSLGYANQASDLKRLRDPRFIDDAAASLAQGILHFNQWLEESKLEAY